MVEVKIDVGTGKAELVRIAAAHECGQAINPVGHEGQVASAGVMVAGWTLTEELRSREGKILNDNFRDYKLLLVPDAPECSVIEVESYKPEGPCGAKEAGEGLTVPAGEATANAVCNAIGVRI